MAPICSGCMPDEHVTSIPYSLPRVHRKFTKHLVEKKRRDRINQSLEQLKDLLIGTVHVDPATYEKMEKADILQMTVEYMKRLASLPDTSDQNRWYSSGYDKCRRVAHAYLLSSRLGHDANTRLVCDARSNVALRRPAIDVCRSRQRCDIRDVTPDNVVDLDDKDAATSSETACDVFNTEVVVCRRKPLKIHVCSSIGNVWRPW